MNTRTFKPEDSGNQPSGLWLSYLSLFTSLGTIMCCALPSLLVALGMGAAFAGLIGVVPQIVVLSEYKLYVFGVSGALIALSTLVLYLNRNAPCPIDPGQARACATARKWSMVMVGVSAAFWGLGFIAAYVAPLFI